MSKKLIAVASAAALALSALVATPAMASITVGTVLGASEASAAAGTTELTANAINVPSSDVLRYNIAAGASDIATGTLVRYPITTLGDTDVVTVTATGGIKLITQTQFAAATAPTTATGTTSASVTAVGKAAHIYAYTTSTTAGTITFSVGANQAVRYLKGLSTMPYKLILTGPATAPLSGEFTVSGRVVDAFGNDLTTALTPTTATDFTVTAVGATFSTDTAKSKYTASSKTYSFVFTAPSTATGTAVNIAFGSARATVAVTAFGAPVATQFFTVNAVDLTAQLASLTAQVAALTADYNKLANRWNKKVDNKRTLKKKVALK